MSDKTLREAAQELVEFKGPCLDGFVRHVGEPFVEALAAALADSADAPEFDETKAEDTETICLEIVKVLGIANFDIHSYEQSFDLKNCVAAFAMRCEEDGRSFQRLIDKTKSLEVKSGFIPDRRTADAPEGPWHTEKSDYVVDTSELGYVVTNGEKRLGTFTQPAAVSIRDILNGDAWNRLDAQQKP